MPRREPKWGYLQLMQFVRLLKSHPELWDSSVKGYNNYALRDKALAHIGEKMNSSCDRVRRKIHTMRSQYSKEYRKMKENPEYKPKWKFFNEFRFIFKHTERPDDDPLNDSDDHTKSDSDDEHLIFNDDYTYLNEETPETTIVKIEDNCQYNKALDNSEIIDDIDGISNHSNSLPSQKRKCSEPTTMAEVVENSATEELENITTELNEIVEDERDEFAVFGDNIANELRILKEYRSIQLALKCKIIRAVLEANEALHRVGWIK